MNKKLIYILIIVFTAQFSCNRTEEYDTLVMQKERILDYLVDYDLDYSVRDDVYTVPLNTLENSSTMAISAGDSVYFNYASYTFVTAPVSLYTTNISEVAEDAGMAFEGPFTPLGIKYGESDIIEGLEIGLRGLMQNDSVMLFIPSDLAFKDKAIGTLSEYCTLAMFIDIVEIVKN
ncbi:MAG: FKBP-type peptidyl-prolyl cis-trans isomerase [Rikenellaceae bacterium]